MTRRKSVCFKWTLVLVLVVFCPFVHPRPQDTQLSESNVDLVKPTENPIRYRFRHVSSNPKTSLDLSIPDLNNNFTNNSIIVDVSTDLVPNYLENNNSNIFTHRLSRVIRHRYKNRVNNDTKQKDSKHSTSKPQVVKDLKSSSKVNNGATVQKDLIAVSRDKNKPVIKKVVTKWTDNAKYEGLDFSYETTVSNQKEMSEIKYTDRINNAEFDTTENEDSSELSDKRYPDKRYRPRPNLHHAQYSEENQVYTNNVQIVDSYFPSTRPPYVFNTPTPTPIITNVGYPQPWPQPQPTYQVYHPRPTTQKPIKTAKPVKSPYNYHNTFQNNYPPYPGNNFEVTTFQPTTAYTDRIVIRPEEYSASPEDCPTIFLTLNNTFQGQGKEACPDLNIAVNTNVINKNVVVESDEENDASFTDAFGLPLGDDSESEEAAPDYFDSAETQEEESASVESTGLTNYNAANIAESAEPEGFGSPSAPLSALSKPGRPNDDDDDNFGFSSIISFFKPAISAFAWLATINPLSFGILSMVLAPLVILVAGTSGIAALFAPWAFSYGREAPKVVQIYKPQWQWDDDDKAWQVNSFPDRQWRPTSPRVNSENTMRSSVTTTWFYKLKEAMKALTHTLRASTKNYTVQENHKSKRKKRETWTIRVKRKLNYTLGVTKRNK